MEVKKSDNTTDGVHKLREALNSADAVMIGGGAGLSASAGFVYTGERFEKYFRDFAEKYRFNDMYSGGFYPYNTLEEHWAYWSRYIYINRYTNAPKPVYDRLYELVKDKDYPQCTRRHTSPCTLRVLCLDNQRGSLFPEGRL